MSNAAPKLYAVLASYETPEELLAAAAKIRDAGYTKTDALVPFPVHGLDDALGLRKSRMAALVFCGAAAGAVAGFALQYWVSVMAYPHIVSGRPYFSWPNFVPVIFECTILFAGLTAFIGMLARNGLPQPWHPLFDSEIAQRGTTDRFVLVVEAADPKFDARATMDLLKATHPEAVDLLPVPSMTEDPVGH